MATALAAHLTDCYEACVKDLNDRYETRVRRHLSKVYMIMGCTAAATAVGAVLQTEGTMDLGLWASAATLLMVVGLHFYKDDGKNFKIRLAMLYAFGFFAGQTLGPLLGYVGSVDPAVVATALIGTFVTLVTLSLTALLSEQRKFLFLGGTLGSVINTLAVMTLFNMMFQSYVMQMVQLYVGVFVMAALVVHDTQDIVQKCRSGNNDVVQHAMDLFFDMVSLFRRVLLILEHNAEAEQNATCRSN